MRARGTFEIDGWEEEPYDERDGVRLTRTRVTKTFRGEVEGTSTAELLMAYDVADEGVAYAGLERVIASIAGRDGSFVLQHAAGPSGASWSVVPGTGTGGLAGLAGDAAITAEPDGGHSFALDYSLGEG